MSSGSTASAPMLAARSSCKPAASSSATRANTAWRARLGTDMGRGASSVTPGRGQASASARKTEAFASPRSMVTIRNGLPLVSKKMRRASRSRSPSLTHQALLASTSSRVSAEPDSGA